MIPKYKDLKPEQVKITFIWRFNASHSHTVTHTHTSESGVSTCKAFTDPDAFKSRFYGIDTWTEVVWTSCGSLLVHVQLFGAVTTSYAWISGKNKKKTPGFPNSEQNVKAGRCFINSCCWFCWLK